MKFKVSAIAILTAGLLAAGSTASFAQIPAPQGGSGEHKVGAGPDTKSEPMAMPMKSGMHMKKHMKKHKKMM